MKQATVKKVVGDRVCVQVNGTRVVIGWATLYRMIQKGYSVTIDT